MSKEDLKLSRELTDWVQVTQSDKRYRGFLLGHKMEDVLQSCVLNGVDCRALNLLDHKSVPSLGSCFCVGCNPGIRYRYPSNRAKQSLNGLHLLLNVQLEEYLPLTVEAGFLIMIHHPWAEEDITQDVTFVAPGSATFISVLMCVFNGLIRITGFLGRVRNTDCEKVTKALTICKRFRLSARFHPHVATTQRMCTCD
ncbi:acid-sensing ion channel 4-A-like [Ixodes scapularis]